jgi:3D-(3,5/4)-trihydroxycyclohexane-1,2-dione acylhydrolase (decyclizing)
VALLRELAGYQPDADRQDELRRLVREWDDFVDQQYHSSTGTLPSQVEVIGALDDQSWPEDVVVCAAGSMPGELHRYWRPRGQQQYHVEYGYSCMGYEVAGGLGVKLARPDREVFVLVGDGSYLMMSQELVTSIQEGAKLIVVLVDNRGYRSIGSLSRSVGVDGFGTSYQYRSASGQLDGGDLPVDLGMNAASLGAEVLRAADLPAFRNALAQARRMTRTVVIVVDTDPGISAPGYGWWDVPVAEVSASEAVRAARKEYEAAAQTVRSYL